MADLPWLVLLFVDQPEHYVIFSSSSSSSINVKKNIFEESDVQK